MLRANCSATKLLCGRQACRSPGLRPSGGQLCILGRRETPRLRFPESNIWESERWPQIITLGDAFLATSMALKGRVALLRCVRDMLGMTGDPASRKSANE